MFGDPLLNTKNWPITKWSKVLTIVNGKNQKKVEELCGAYPICGSGGEMSRANDWLTRENSVIIGRKGNINSPILMKEKFWNVDTAFGLEPNSEELSHNYLFWFCTFFDFQRLNKAVTIPSLTKADLLELEMPLPDKALQIKFDEIILKVDRALSVAKEIVKEPMFMALSQKAFSGLVSK
jgi:type I restriction enzyme S subunit